MQKHRKYRYKKRTFLNVDEDLRAYIIAYVRQSELDDTYTDIQLEIADCSRHINLDFDFHHNKESVEKAEKKIKLFRQIVNDFADAVEAELELMKSKPYPKKQRKKKKATSSTTTTTGLGEIFEVELDI